MRARMIAGLLLLTVLVPRVASQKVAPPRPLSAPWASSATDLPGGAPASPAIIASSKAGQVQSLPSEVRLPLPDDGLRPDASPPASKLSTSSASPNLMPAMPSAPMPSGPVQHAVYVPDQASKQSTPSATILPVSAPPPLEAEPLPSQASVLGLEVIGPPLVSPGQMVQGQIVVRNLGKLVVGGVRVDLPLPPGLRVLSSTPEAQRENDKVSWHLGNLEAAAERKLQLELQADQPGELHLAPVARFTAAMGWRSRVVRPPFFVKVSGPESALVGEKVILQIQVGNHTHEPIRRVTLRGELSPGLAHSQGQILETDLPEDLAPGQVRTIPLETQACQPGRHTAQLLAHAEGGHSAQSTASLQIQQPALSLRLLGPRQVSAGQEVPLQLELFNPGRKPVGPVRLTQSLPQGVEFLSAEASGTYNPVFQSVVWVLPELGPEQKHLISCKVRARQPGDWAMAAHLEVEGISPVRATHALQIETVPSLSLELTALDDPVAVGQDTTYEVRVYNAGPGRARGVRLTFHVPGELFPVNAEGPTASQIRGQQVFFEPLDSMAGRVDAIYRVRVRGNRPGQGRLRAELHAAGLARPMNQELTAHVRTASSPAAAR